MPIAYSGGNPDVGNRKVVAYNMPGHIVDGNDVLVVYQVAAKRCAVSRWATDLDRVQNLSHPPTPKGCAMPVSTQEEVDVEGATRSKPTNKSSWRMVCRRKTFEEIEADTQALIEDASEFAKNSPRPMVATATDYIYSA
ncbi:MAG: hypothetical protein R3E79_09560 [Caldilineaceae bacterium]